MVNTRPSAPLGLVLTLIMATLLSVACGGPETGGSSGAAGGDAGQESTTSGGDGPERIRVGGGEALIWGDGSRGVVLSHGAAYDAASWSAQARKMARSGALVLAVEDTSPGSITAAADYLREERGVDSVALIGASAGAPPVLEAAQEPGTADQVMLLSGTGDTSGLGKFPKLFVASEGEGIAGEVREMANQAPGNRNEVLILEGSAHAQAIFETDQGDKLLDTIIGRLREYG